MCISAAVIAGASLAVSAVGTVASIDNANYQAKMQQFQLEEQQSQLRQQMEMQRLQGMEAEAARLEEFRRQRAANMAVLAGDGMGQNMSFLQGIDKAEQRALRYDLANIRIGDLQGRNRLSSDIRVNRIAGQVNRANRSAALTGALIDFAGSAVKAGNYYGNNRTPGGGGSSGSSGSLNTAILPSTYRR